MPGTHVALLRGINVGSAKRVNMAELGTMVEALGYSNVRTLLNSGNIVLSAPRAGAGTVGARIQSGLEARLKVKANVIVLTAKEFAATVTGNPLLKVADNHSLLFVTVFANDAARSRLLPLTRQKWPGESLALGVHAAFMWAPSGSLNSPLVLAAHKVLKDGATTRNWATMLKLQAVLDE